MLPAIRRKFHRTQKTILRGLEDGVTRHLPCSEAQS
jgi:hypothetical protein